MVSPNFPHVRGPFHRPPQAPPHSAPAQAEKRRTEQLEKMAPRHRASETSDAREVMFWGPVEGVTREVFLDFKLFGVGPF